MASSVEYSVLAHTMELPAQAVAVRLWKVHMSRNAAVAARKVVARKRRVHMGVYVGGHVPSRPPPPHNTWRIFWPHSHFHPRMISGCFDAHRTTISSHMPTMTASNVWVQRAVHPLCLADGRNNPHTTQLRQKENRCRAPWSFHIPSLHRSRTSPPPLSPVRLHVEKLLMNSQVAVTCDEG